MAEQTKATQRFAEFISELSYSDIQKEAIEEAKKDLLEILGFAFAAHEMYPSVEKMISSCVLGSKGKPEATVWLRGDKVPAPNASLANGWYLGSGDRFSFGHFSGPIHAAAIATSELRNASGKELLTSMIAGYEICLRIGKAIQPSHLSKGFSYDGTFGAAAASAKALNLEGKKTLNALGLAGLQAPGLMEWTPESYCFMNGRAAQSGVIAAFLAQRGFTAPHRIIEGNMGFCSTTADHCNYAKMFEGLGEKFEITHLYHIPYPGCRHTHSAVDATLQILKEHPFAPDDVDEITVRTYKASVHLGSDYEPALWEGKLTPGLSCPLTLAVLITKGRLTNKEFFNSDWSDPKLLGLAKKVRMKMDPELDKLQQSERGTRASIVEIKLKDGTKHTLRIDYAKGEPENPMSFKEISESFKMKADSRISQLKMKEIIETIKNLEKLKGVSDLCVKLKVSSMHPHPTNC